MRDHQTREVAYAISAREAMLRKRLSAAMLVGVLIASYFVARQLRDSQRSLDEARSMAAREALRSELIVASAPVGIMTCDEHGIVLSANPATEELTGWPSSEIVGKRSDVIIPPEDRAAHHAGMMNAATAIKANSGDWLMLLRDARFSVLRKDGSTGDITASIRVIKFMGEIEFIVLMRKINGGQNEEELIPFPKVSQYGTAAAMQRARQ